MSIKIQIVREVTHVADNKAYVEFGFVDYPEWGHYNVVLDCPCDEESITQAIQTRAAEIKAAQDASESFRQQLESDAMLSPFDIEV